MKHHYKLLIGISILVLAILGAVVLKTNYAKAPNTPPHTFEFSNSDVGISIRYDTYKAQSIVLTAKDSKDQVILRLTDKGQGATPFLITFRYESKLAKASAITRQSLLDYLEGNAKLTLPKRNPDYRLIQQKRITLGSSIALRFIFSYLTGSLPTTQQLIIVPIDTDRAMYISMQGKTNDYSKLEQEIFIPLIESLEFKTN